jgi:hypothetical protein
LNSSTYGIGGKLEPDGIVCREAEIKIVLTSWTNSFIGADVRD